MLPVKEPIDWILLRRLLFLRSNDRAAIASVAISCVAEEMKANKISTMTKVKCVSTLSMATTKMIRA